MAEGTPDRLNYTDFVKSRLDHAAGLVCTGSLLPGVPDDGYVGLIQAGRRAAVPVIIDTAGPALMRCAEASPEIIKVNLQEAESAVGLAPGESAEPGLTSRALDAASALHDISGSAVIVTVASGAVLREPGRAVMVPAPAVRVCSEVGAGDSFLAGLAASLMRHGDPLAACRRAVAVAAASVESPQPGWLDAAVADKLEQRIVPEIIG